MLLRYIIGLLAATSLLAQPLYFPSSNESWERLSRTELGWCPDAIDSLVTYLQESDTRAFIILKDGKIAMERYFGTFTADSAWYWASAGKTVTAALVGIAQAEGKLDISRPSSTYLGNGWSSCTPSQEANILVRHHLTMTTGIGFDRGNDNCTTPDCLRYRATPGTLWDYHNATYLLLQNMVANAAGMSYQAYYSRKLAQPVDMPGLWINGVLWSKPIAMARFGLLLLARGVWNGDTIIRDESYLDAMINTSQDLNRSYGYLFWLNGKGSFMQPQIPFVIPRDLVPPAPKDMFAGMGKNDQRLYVVPSQRLVVVRMGDPADTIAAAISGFDDELWKRINALPCATSVSGGVNSSPNAWPNPASTSLSFDGDHADLYDVLGTLVARGEHGRCDVSHLPRGTYYLVLRGTTSSSCSTVVLD